MLLHIELVLSVPLNFLIELPRRFACTLPQLTSGLRGLFAEALTGAENLGYGYYKYFTFTGASCIKYTVESRDNSLGFDSWCVVRSFSPLRAREEEIPSPSSSLLVLSFRAQRRRLHPTS
jgi:hypothetical protein